MDKPNKPFKIPKAFLTQLEEFTKGFYLVVIDDENNFQTYSEYPDVLTELGMLNFVDIQTTAMQKAIREEVAEIDLEELDDEGEDVESTD